METFNCGRRHFKCCRFVVIYTTVITAWTVGTNYNYKPSLLTLGKGVLRDNANAVHEFPDKGWMLLTFILHGPVEAQSTHNVASDPLTHANPQNTHLQ